MSKKEYTTDELDRLYQEWSDTVSRKYNGIIFPKLQELAERARLVQDPSEFAGLVVEFYEADVEADGVCLEYDRTMLFTNEEFIGNQMRETEEYDEKVREFIHQYSDSRSSNNSMIDSGLFDFVADDVRIRVNRAKKKSTNLTGEQRGLYIELGKIFEKSTGEFQRFVKDR